MLLGSDSSPDEEKRYAWEGDGRVSIPMDAIIDLWIRYAGNDRTGHGMFYYNDGRVHLPESIWSESGCGPGVGMFPLHTIFW